MTCCKAEKYYWCKDEPVVNYQDEGDKHYCVFHAPKGKKEVSPEEFNERVFEKIEKAKKKNIGCDFSGTIFEWDISFSHFQKGNPLPEIDFYYTTFLGKAIFNFAFFSKEANFFRATFNNIALFSGATFNSGADFSSTIFSEKMEFSESTSSNDPEVSEYSAYEPVDFYRSVFKGVALFSGTKFLQSVQFERTTFEKNAYFIGFKDFFKKGGKRVELKEPVFKKAAFFENILIGEKLIFEACDLSKVSFQDTDLRKADFIICDWHEKKSGEKMLHDEAWQLGLNDKKSAHPGNLEKIEILYRRLKQKYTDEHDWPEVSNWHFREKEMARWRAGWSTWMRLTLYWFSCGYGERPRRAAGVFLGLIILSTLATALAGLTPVDKPEWVAGLQGFWKLPAYFLNTLQGVTFLKTPYFEPSNLIGAGIKFLSQVLVPVQAAFLVLALRNRFRR